jgi:membrane protein
VRSTVERRKEPVSVGIGSKLLMPVVVVAAVARSRRRASADADGSRPGSREGSQALPTGGATSRGGGDGSASRTRQDGTGSRGAQQRGSGGGGAPGDGATKPTQIPAAGWKEILKRTKEQVKKDNLPLLAAGVAFYIFVALFPALIAAITVYGLVADPQEVEEQIAGLTEALPDDVSELITNQLQDIASGSEQALGIGLILSLGGALFAASGGVQNLIKAVNIAYDEEETRGFVKLRGLALLMTLAAVVFLAVAVGLIAVLPVVFEVVGLDGIALVGVQIARWVGLVVFVMVALAVLYRYAPDRDAPRFTWVGLGSIVATVLWVLGSAGFSLYVSNFGNYGETYGALAGVVVLLLWLFLTSFIVLLGAEINSESELQTTRDTTKGPEQPMGERDAVKADNAPPGAG